MDQMAGWTTADQFKAVMDTVYSLEVGAQAIKYVDGGYSEGKVVVIKVQ